MYGKFSQMEWDVATLWKLRGLHSTYGFYWAHSHWIRHDITEVWTASYRVSLGGIFKCRVACRYVVSDPVWMHTNVVYTWRLLEGCYTYTYSYVELRTSRNCHVNPVTPTRKPWPTRFVLVALTGRAFTWRCDPISVILENLLFVVRQKNHNKNQPLSPGFLVQRQKVIPFPRKWEHGWGPLRTREGGGGGGGGGRHLRGSAKEYLIHISCNYDRGCVSGYRD